MLVFKRFENERIVITVPPSATATRIEVEVTESHGRWAKLGTEAPRRVVVDRAEIDRVKTRDAQRAPSAAGAVLVPR